MSKEKLKTEIECSCFDTLLVLELSSLIVAALKLSKGSSNLNIVGEPNKLKKSMEKEHQDTLSSKEKEDQIMQKLRTRRLHYSWASCTGRKQQISNTVGCPDQKDRKREGKEKKKKKKRILTLLHEVWDPEAWFWRKAAESLRLLQNLVAEAQNPILRGAKAMQVASKARNGGRRRGEEKRAARKEGRTVTFRSSSSKPPSQGTTSHKASHLREE